MSNDNDKQAQENRTAQRFPVHVPIRVKVPGSDSEVVYSTRDVSHRGIFVVTDQPLPEDSQIEFTMQLKSASSPRKSLQVMCRGTVVRVESGDDDNVGMAATIDSYRFLHTNKGNA